MNYIQQPQHMNYHKQPHQEYSTAGGNRLSVQVPECKQQSGAWLPITAVYCQLTAFATGNGLKAITAYLLQ
jgi:hypothetical protein